MFKSCLVLSMQHNVMVFIAELYWWFETVKPEFVQPRDLQEFKDGEHHSVTSTHTGGKCHMGNRLPCVTFKKLLNSQSNESITVV